MRKLSGIGALVSCLFISALSAPNPSCRMEGAAGEFDHSVCREFERLKRYALDPLEWQKWHTHRQKDMGDPSGLATVVTGYYGVGKTYTVGTMARLAGVPVEYVQVGTLETPLQIDGALRNINAVMQRATQRAQQENRVVLVFIDETSADDAPQQTPTGLRVLWSIISGHISNRERDPRVQVFFTAKNLADLSAGLRGRTNHIHLQLPNLRSRQQLFEQAFVARGISLPSEIAAYYATYSEGMTPRTIMGVTELVSDTCGVSAQKPCTVQQYKDAFFEARNKMHDPYRNCVGKAWHAATSREAWQVYKGIIGTVAALMGIAQAYNGSRRDGGGGPGPSDPKPPMPPGDTNPDSPQ